MKQSPGNSRGDRDQFPLPLKNLHLPGLREFGQIDGASAANSRGIGFIGGNARKLWQQLPGMNEELLQLLTRATLYLSRGVDLF